MPQALSKMDLVRGGGGKAVARDETASKRGYNYVTVFIDLDRKQKPVIFVTPGKGCLVLFRRFLRKHGGIIFRINLTKIIWLSWTDPSAPLEKRRRQTEPLL
ncbi:hypothetical protein DFAR_2710006 [Desulfarculales bacterium]